jgi:hypothetical protein
MIAALIGIAAVGGSIFAASPAYAYNKNGLSGCAAITGYTWQDQGYKTKVCSQVHPGVVVRAVATCGDGTTRYGAWASTASSSYSTAYCPVGYSVTGGYLQWYQSQG